MEKPTLDEMIFVVSLYADRVREKYSLGSARHAEVLSAAADTLAWLKTRQVAGRAV